MKGRPSDYTDQLAYELCEWIADGNSLRSWCDQDGHPTFSTIYRWMEEREGFKDAYMRARELQAHNDADRMNQVAAQVASGELKPDQGRVMMDALKWTAGKRGSRWYGDKIQLSGDADGAPLVVTWAAGEKA